MAASVRATDGGISGVYMRSTAPALTVIPGCGCFTPIWESGIIEPLPAGAVIAKAAHQTFWGGYAGYFQDPDGHVWEVVFNPLWGE